MSRESGMRTVLHVGTALELYTVHSSQTFVHFGSSQVSCIVRRNPSTINTCNALSTLEMELHP